MRSFLAVVLACVSLALGGGTALAEWKPDRPVTVIVPNNAGGGADFFARLLADKVSKIWGQPVIVENHGGAAGRVGTQLAVRAAPDGYTILQAQNPLVVWPAIYTNMPFDAQTDLVPVTSISTILSVITLNPSIKATSLSELVAYAKEHPGEINFTSNGIGTQSHLSFSLFQKNAGIEMTHIPYTGTPQRMAGMLANEVQLDMGGLTLNQSPIDEGTLIALAVTSTERLASLPNVPTAREAGFPDLEIASWDGIFLPAGAPADVVEGVRAAYVEALKDPEVIDQLTKQGRLAYTRTPEEFRAFFNQELELYERMAEAAGIEKTDATK